MADRILAPYGEIPSKKQEAMSTFAKKGGGKLLSGRQRGELENLDQIWLQNQREQWPSGPIKGIKDSPTLQQSWRLTEKPKAVL